MFCVNNTKQYQTISNNTKQNQTKQTKQTKTKQKKGASYLNKLTTNYYFKDELHILPATVSFANGFILVPWVIKPLYGFISDSFPIGGKRRTPYFFLFGLVGFGAWMSLATLSKDVFCLSLFVLSFHGNSFCECLSRFAVFLYLYHINKYIHII